MIADTVKKSNAKYSGIYRGKVEDENDPLKLGRVKIRIHPMMNAAAITKEMLPWAVPGYPMVGGSGDAGAFGFFAVPRLGSEVWCFFEMDDPMQPVYFAEAANKNHGMVADKGTNYPKGIAWWTKDGMKIYMDDHIIRITHADGHVVLMDKDKVQITQKDGNVLCMDPTVIRLTHKTGAVILIDPTGTIKLTALNEVNITAMKKILLNTPDKIYLDGGMGVIINSGLLLDTGNTLSKWTQAAVGTGTVSNIMKIGQMAYSLASGNALGALAGISQLLPALPAQFTASLPFNPGLLGDALNGDFMSLDFINSAVKSAVGIDAMGILVDNGAGFVRAVSTALPLDRFSDLSFLVDQSNPLAAKMDILIDGVSAATNIDCSSVLGSFAKEVPMNLVSTTVSDLEANIGGLNIFEGI